MKIQIWRRKNREKEKYNLYIRYRLSQIKAKVESLKLWEWISPKNISQKEHNLNVKRAYEEILRRKKDDFENNRNKIDFNSKQSDEFEFIFKKYSKIKNYNAVFNFLKKLRIILTSCVPGTPLVCNNGCIFCDNLYLSFIVL